MLSPSLIFAALRRLLISASKAIWALFCLNLTPEDVESLEQAERSLQSFDAVLQRLEIAPENQLSDLRALLHSTATRFESLDPAPALPTAPPVAVSDAELPENSLSPA